MVENYLATRVEHKVDRVFKKDLIKVYYQCTHCQKVHSHGALPQEVHTALHGRDALYQF
eukprot:SAG22_NODE_658_length_8076_cov_4.575279_2_plen_59_part_00